MILAMLAGAAAVPMEPSGKWQVNYGVEGCAMGRVFGADKDEVTLIWQALPLEEKMRLSVMMPGSGAAMYRGVADIAVAPGSIDSQTFESFGTKNGKRVVRMQVNTGQFADLADRATLTLTPSRGRPLSFVLINAKRAFAALATCNDATLKDWKIDPGERERMAVPARPRDDMADWFSFSDYPQAAISAGQLGTTAMLYTIGLDGRVPECRVVIGSGSPPLDKATCDTIKARGDFIPAIGQDGKPMITHGSRRVVWSLPGAWEDDIAYRRRQIADRRAWEAVQKGTAAAAAAKPLP